MVTTKEDIQAHYKYVFGKERIERFIALAITAAREYENSSERDETPNEVRDKTYLRDVVAVFGVVPDPDLGRLEDFYRLHWW